jgi:hypothetical protein
MLPGLQVSHVNRLFTAIIGPYKDYPIIILYLIGLTAIIFYQFLAWITIELVTKREFVGLSDFPPETFFED